MTTALVPLARRHVLADLAPGSLVRDAALVLGGAAVLGLLGQVAVPLPFTPIPLSLATFAVLLLGAALGPMRAASSMVVCLAVGLVGVPWLMAYAHVGLGKALTLGALPFLLGDAIKLLAATGLLPTAWRLVHDAEAR